MKRVWLAVALFAVLACDKPASRWSKGTVLVHKASGERVVALEPYVSGKINCRVPGKGGCWGAYETRTFYDEELMTLRDWEIMQLKEEIRRYELLMPLRKNMNTPLTNQI